jgi:hypothetical protein
MVPFSIGNILMKFCATWYIYTSKLLGRPGQYDRKTIHDGVKNRCTIIKDGKTITLIPLTPRQVYDDQIKLKREHEAIERENQGDEQGDKTNRFGQNPKHHYNPFGHPSKHIQIFSQHSKQIRTFDHYSKTPKYSREWR